MWAVIHNHDLRRQKKTDNRESLSRHRPVASDMKKLDLSQRGDRGFLSAKMVQVPPG
jgi:hypothetical protein